MTDIRDCLVRGCDAPVRCRGLCGRHEAQARRGGRPWPVVELRDELVGQLRGAARQLEKVADLVVEVMGDGT